MKKILPYLLLLTMAFTACRKTESPNKPATQNNGELTGVINPAGAVEKIIIDTVINGQRFIREVITDTKGNFKFTDIPAGGYWLKFTAMQGYYTPNSLPVSVEAGKSSSAGVIVANEKPDVGNLYVKVNPVRASAWIALTDVNTTWLVYYATYDAGTGKYMFENIPSGTYTLTSKPAAGFTNAESQTVTIKKHKETNAGTLFFGTSEMISQMSYTVAGQQKSYVKYAVNSDSRVDIKASYTAQSLVLKGTYKTGNIQISNYHAEELVIKLDEVTGPGTYTCKGTAASEMTFRQSYSFLIDRVLPGSSSKPGGSATVIITEIDEAGKTISGTFSGTLVWRIYPDIASQKVTDGTFKVRYE